MSKAYQVYDVYNEPDQWLQYIVGEPNLLNITDILYLSMGYWPK